MTRNSWVRLDNASNIFLAARSQADPKVFRVSAEMDHTVDPEQLQDAVDEVYDRYPLYHAVLRRGVFWHYLQDSALRPQVTGEELHPCAPIYQPHWRTLLFRVFHHRQRISLEVFHALSDGTGALWFLNDVVAAYLRRRNVGMAEQRSAPRGGDIDRPVHELATDSFTDYFRNPADRSAGGFRADDEPTSPAAQPQPASRRPLKKTNHVYRVRGTRTPDRRTRLVELTVPAADVLALARAEGVSLTIYLITLFFESLRLASGGLGKTKTLAASVPVNLRQFFPSMSARNFFTTVRVEHTYGRGSDELGSIARELEDHFRSQATPQALERKLRGFIRFERMPVLRVMPRPLKDALLKLINWGNNRGLSIATSNLGRVVLPDAIDPAVRRMFFHVSAVRPQFCAISHAGMMTISFTSPFVETDHVREFARLLTHHGVPVSVAAARVTEDELSGVDLRKAHE